ncbi:MAG TPA: EamA family transporter [Alphaproteobacteria bacterium]|nr:EamA family transporter [Alphaproteobacteria bacterium]
MTKKNKSTQKQRTSLSAIILVVICTLFTAAGQYFIKKGLLNVGNFWDLINFYLIGGFVIYGLGAILLIKALRRGSLSVLYPIIALGFIWVALLGTLVLGEKLTTLNWLGIFSIICGVTFVGLSENYKGDSK